MHEKAVTMGDDERPIKEIFLVVYYENGQEAAVPWLAVYEGDWIAHRVNAAHVESVWYGRPPEAAADGAGTVAVDAKER